MLKKCISMLLLVTLLFSFVGCGEDSSSGDDVAAGNYGADNESSDTTHTHSYTEEIDEPSCRFSGMRIFTCSCGDYYTEDIPATGVHTWANATCEKAKHCTGCYLEEGEPLGHSWKDATCEDPKTCSRCGEKDGWSGTGHTWQAATCKAPKTCTKCGETSGSELSYHSYSSATCTEPKKCTFCGVTEGSAKGHDYNLAGVCRACGKKDPKSEAAMAKCSLEVPTNGKTFNSYNLVGELLGTYELLNVEYSFEYNSSTDDVDLNVKIKFKVLINNDSSSNILTIKVIDEFGEVVSRSDTEFILGATGDIRTEELPGIYHIKPGKYTLIIDDYHM